jgi:hypothetical protein
VLVDVSSVQIVCTNSGNRTKSSSYIRTYKSTISQIALLSFSSTPASSSSWVRVRYRRDEGVSVNEVLVKDIHELILVIFKELWQILAIQVIKDFGKKEHSLHEYLNMQINRFKECKKRGCELANYIFHLAE